MISSEVMQPVMRLRSQALKSFRPTGAKRRKGEKMTNSANEVVYLGSLTTDLRLIECSYLVQSVKYHITILIQNHKSTILDVPYVPNLERAGLGSIDENLTSPR